MRRWLLALAVLTAAASTAAHAVDLSPGWQMVSFNLPEPLPLHRFDVIDDTTGERKTFSDVSAPGADIWVERQLWWYDPAAQGYATVEPDGDVEPERGYWVYVHSQHSLSMVPTYDITDCFPTDLDVTRTLQALAQWRAGTFWVTYAFDRQSSICGRTGRGRYEAYQPVGGGEVFKWRRNWFASSESGVSFLGIDDPALSPFTSARFTPPVLLPNRMYPSETVDQTVVASPVCNFPGLDVPVTLRLAGVERIDTALGSLVCLKVEETLGAGLGRQTVWYAPGIGDVRALEWDEDGLHSAKELRS